MGPRRPSAAGAWLAVTLAALAAAAEQPRDYDDREGGGDTLWDDVAHPHRERWLTLVAQGKQLVKQHAWSQAADVLGEAVKLEPREADGHYYLGCAQAGLGQAARCAESLQTTLALAPDYVPEGDRASSVHLRLGDCLLLSGRVYESVEPYQRALGDTGLVGAARAHGLLALGDALQALGRLGEAEAAYQGALEVNRTSPAGFALAVAYDRDDEPARAEAILRDALKNDPTLSGLSTSSYIFVPPEDEDYYRGFAYQVAVSPEYEGRKPCLAWTCRALAIVHFRRYLARAGDSPYARNARDHLAALGSAAAGEGDVEVRASDAVAGKPFAKVALAAALKMQACLQTEPLALLRVEVTIAGKPPAPAAPKPPAQRTPAKKPRQPPPPPPPPNPAPTPGPPVTRVLLGGPVEASADAVACVKKLGAELTWPANTTTGAIVVSWAVISP